MTGVHRVWTIGHSNHTPDHFVDLLRRAAIDVVADVRSVPFSRFNQHFNREPIKAMLAGAGVRYVFLGEELGGRPSEQSMYDDDGHVLYREVAKAQRFRTGLDRVIQGASTSRVALMCSEESPVDCHRRLLVTRVLQDRHVDVSHIRGDATTVDERELAIQLAGPEQPSLFSTGEEAPWRSVRSVSPNTPPRSSSSH